MGREWRNGGELAVLHPREHLTSQQREALWKWRWLGLRNSTPAFKLSLILLAFAALGILLKAL